jgi:prepilin-type N-terminal cleavage/methylation domain-containing protein
MKITTRRRKTEDRNRRAGADNNASGFPASDFGRGAVRGFSLIELLVVIGVIVVLAALTFPVMNAIQKQQTLHRAQVELKQIETAIEDYKTKLGFYPPDNPLTPPDWTKNQLYYELLGTMLTTIAGQPTFQTLDGSAQVRNNTAAFQAAFGATTTVTRFMNCAKAGAGDDAPNAVKFLVGLKPAQFLAVNNPVTSTVLGISMSGRPVFTGPTGEIIPYAYNSSNPQYNPKSFDLWVDVLAGGKIYRVNNWSEKPIIVP